MGQSLAIPNWGGIEVLIQVDDPASKKIFAEGAAVSIDFAPERVRLLGR
ncbi:MAG: hypothetical protein LBS64_02100 [Spirochaetaceae bacterium]|jgi:iron(III) transport system ATP-binding protein|nr:hypothetical protein [Spirochaetaceae bacterium]